MDVKSMKTTQILLAKLLILVTMSSLSAQDDSVPAAGLQESDSGLRSDVPDAQSATQKEIDRSSAIDKSRLAGCDLHTIGIYGQESSGDDRVYVTVKNTGRPMVIVLCSYMETQWNVTIEPGADVRQLIASGWFEQEIIAPKEIPVHIVVGCVARNAKHFWAYSWHTKEGRDARKRVRELTDLEITTFQGFYNGSRHIIDGKSGLVRELDKERTPAEEAAQKKHSGGMDDMPEMIAAYHTQLMGAKSLGNQDEVEKYEDALAYALLSVRLQKEELQTSLEELKKADGELQAAGQKEDAQLRIELKTKIGKLEQTLALPEKYNEFLPKRTESPVADASADKTSPSAIDQARLVGCDVHVLRVRYPRKRDDDRIYLHVKSTGRPMVVVLSCGVSLQWNLDIDPNADLKQLIILGHYEQSVDKLPENVPVFTSIGNEEDFYTTDWHSINGRQLKQRVLQLTGLNITTFQGAFEADRHVIDGVAGLVTELEKERPEEPLSVSEYEVAVQNCEFLLRRILGEMSAGKDQDAREVLDGLVHHLIQARLAQPRVRSELAELRKSLDQLRAAGEKDDSARMLELHKRIAVVSGYLNLPDAEEYRDLLPSLPGHGEKGDNPAESTPAIPIAELQRKKADAEAIWRTAETLTLEEAKRIRNETATASPETLRNLKDQLAKSVRNSFDRQLELQEIRMQLAAAELSSLQQKQSSRKKTADLIIERRVEDLLTGADLSWPQASHSNEPGSPDSNGGSDPMTNKAALRCNTPEELLETLRQFPQDGDPAAIVTYFTDNAVEEFAGTLLMTVTMFSSVVPMMAAQADADPKSTQMMLQIVEIMGRSMKTDATKEARDAYTRMSSRTNVMMAAFREGPAYADVDEFEADLRNSVGMLRDPRAFVVEVFNAMQSESDSSDASLLKNFQPDQKTTWTLQYSDNGKMATATPDSVSSEGEQVSTLQLSRTEQGWRVHKLFDKATLAKLATGPTVSSDSLNSDDLPAETN
jgi:hypothetical protein